MTTVINIHKDSFMFMTGVMSCLCQSYGHPFKQSVTSIFLLNGLYIYKVLLWKKTCWQLIPY